MVNNQYIVYAYGGFIIAIFLLVSSIAILRKSAWKYQHWKNTMLTFLQSAIFLFYFFSTVFYFINNNITC